MIETVHGEPGWRLSGELVSLWLTCRGGHLAPVEFRLGGRVVSPYALAPWTPGEVEGSQPALLAVLRGDFLCFPFGPQGDGPPHGVTANGDWQVVSGGDGRLHLGIDDPDSGGWLEKIITLRDGETAIYAEHRISGVSGDFSYGNHPVLDFTPLAGGEGRVSVSPFRWASVYRGLFSDPANREYGALKPFATFTDLTAVPLANGGTTDLTRYPKRQGFDDLVMFHAQPATPEQPFAWSAAVLDGYVWFSLKNPADFPCTLLWMSNGGRHGAPWNGRHLSRMGIEEVCSHFADSVEISRTNPLAAEGVPTVRKFRKDETVSLKVVQAVAETPPGFGRVVSIVPDGPGKIVITGESGTSTESAVDWQFVLSPTQPRNP